MNRFVKSSKGASLGGGAGGAGLIDEMQDKPGAFIVKENPLNEVDGVTQMNANCNTCEGVGIVASYKPNISSSLNDIIWTAQTITYLNLIEDWLKKTNDEYAIIVEDDYDLLMSKYWHFDWEYLMNNIPYDWDVIQLSYEIFFNKHIYYPCFLHPTMDSSGIGALLINRHFAEKLIRLHKIDGKYCIHKSQYKMSSYNWSNIRDLEEPSSVQEFLQMDYLVKIGRSYSIPLMYSSVDWGKHDGLNNIDAYQYESFKRCEYACKYWWIKLRDRFTLKEFFTYGKPNDKYIIFGKSLDGYPLL
jgi:hypothetical protein